MRAQLLLSLLFVTILLQTADAQPWKRYRHEVWGGIVASNFLGELGGGNAEAQDLFLDFDAKSMRYAFAGGYRFKLKKLPALEAV